MTYSCRTEDSLNVPFKIKPKTNECTANITSMHNSVLEARGATPILGQIRDVRPEWVNFPGQKPVDWCKFLTKNLRMGHNFDIISPRNGWFSSKLNKTYCSLVNFCCK